MSEYRQEIENYGQDVNDFEGSPFENVRMLYDRDLQLIQNAEQIIDIIKN